jgi:hypothetical protein
VYDNLPNTLVIARDWAMSEQKEDMLRDPEGTGKRHAQEWSAHADRLGLDLSKTFMLGINEPSVWDPGVPEALRLYTIALCDEGTALNLRVGALQLSVGWPANTGPDTPSDWGPYWGVDEAIKRGNHVLVVHEYWADAGPADNWGWWCGRVLTCPWNVPIIVGETGIDQYVKYSDVSQQSRGWQGVPGMSPERYAGELADYNYRMTQDPRFKGSNAFTCDFANSEWASFDVEPSYNALRNYHVPANSWEAHHVVSADQNTVYLPYVEG